MVSLTLAISVAPALLSQVGRHARQNKPQGSPEYTNPQPSRGPAYDSRDTPFTITKKGLRWGGNDDQSAPDIRGHVTIF